MVGREELTASAMAVRMTQDRSFGWKGGRIGEEPVQGVEKGPCRAPKRLSAGFIIIMRSAYNTSVGRTKDQKDRQLVN